MDGQPSEFFFEWLAKVKSLVAVTSFLPSLAKDLSAPRYIVIISSETGRSGDRMGRDFPHSSRPSLEPSQPPIRTMGTGSFPEVKRPGHGVDHPLPSRAEVKEEV